MTFGIRGNIAKIGLPQVVADALSGLDSRKIKYLVEDELAIAIKKEIGIKVKKETIVTPKDLVKKSDFIVSIGGDGTFLATAKLVKSKGIPIIGVNMGKLGYLAETHITKIVHFICDVIEQHYRIEERTVVSAYSNLNGRTIYGMNEIVISQSGLVKTVFLEVFFNGSLVISYHADGLIVSTPTGSTGYSLSSGGPIVKPDTEVLIICPICPHTLTARPIILPDNGVIKVTIAFKEHLTVTADGNSGFSVKKDAVIEIIKAPYKIKVVKALDSNYFEVLNQKLLWGEDKRNSRSK